jgi:hypothetical protein
MARMVAWLRANDLFWNYWVNNYWLGRKPPEFDILYWNSDTKRLPGQVHCDLLELLETNPYVNAGTLTIRGVPIDLSKVQPGAYRSHHTLARMLRHRAALRSRLDVRACKCRAPAKPDQPARRGEITFQRGAGRPRGCRHLGTRDAGSSHGGQLVAALAHLDSGTLRRSGRCTEEARLAQT